MDQSKDRKEKVGINVQISQWREVTNRVPQRRALESGRWIMDVDQLEKCA